MFFSKSKKITFNVILLLLILTAPIAHAQKLKAWEITYASSVEVINKTAKISDEDKAAMEFLQALSSGKDDKPQLLCYVTLEKLRVEQNAMIPAVYLGNKKDSVCFVYSGSSKTAYKTLLAAPAFIDLGDSVTVMGPDDYKISFESETQVISGITCKKAVIDMGAKMIVWYAENIPQLYWDKYAYLQRIPGCALSIQAEQNGFLIGIKATSVKEMEVNESLFNVPEGYEIIEY